MPEFGIEEPIEDAVQQRIPVDDDGDPPELDQDADWEAAEADVMEQRREVPDEEPRG